MLSLIKWLGLECRGCHVFSTDSSKRYISIWPTRCQPFAVPITLRRGNASVTAVTFE